MLLAVIVFDVDLDSLNKDQHHNYLAPLTLFSLRVTIRRHLWGNILDRIDCDLPSTICDDKMSDHSLYLYAVKLNLEMR